MHAQSAEVEALEIEVELAPHAAQMPARGESAYVLASHSRQTKLPQTHYLLGPLSGLLRLLFGLLGLLSELILGLLRLLGLLQRFTPEH